jgi:hypothetical protein
MAYQVPSGSVAQIGIAYPAYYLSPLLVDKTIRRSKRVRFVYVWFQTILDRFLPSDVNLAAQQWSDLAGLYKHENKANIAVRYQNNQNGELQADLYSREYDELGEQWTQFKEALYGVAVAYQLCVFSLDDGGFVMTGYQFDVDIKDNRFISSE